MAFFYSPKKAIDVILDAKNTESELRRKNSKWYFSEEGRAAYLAADTVGKRTAYFFDYLVTKLLLEEKIKSSTEAYDKGRSTLCKLAYIMAAFVDGKSFAFSDYPEILKPESNPVIPDSLSYFDRRSIRGVICRLHGVDESRVGKNEFYKILEKDKSSELYRLERALIRAFTDGELGVSGNDAFYDYSILSVTNIGGGKYNEGTVDFDD